MTLQEAIRSNKPFKRLSDYTDSHIGWIVYSKNSDQFLSEATGIKLPPSDILATDWIIQEHKLQLSQSQIIAALEQATIETKLSSLYFFGETSSYHVDTKKLLNLLGF